MAWVFRPPTHVIPLHLWLMCMLRRHVVACQTSGIPPKKDHLENNHVTVRQIMCHLTDTYFVTPQKVAKKFRISRLVTGLCHQVIKNQAFAAESSILWELIWHPLEEPSCAESLHGHSIISINIHRALPRPKAINFPLCCFILFMTSPLPGLFLYLFFRDPCAEPLIQMILQTSWAWLKHILACFPLEPSKCLHLIVTVG